MTDTPLRYLAPAKLNLFLHITGQREDGYHSLQTLFQLLDYGDELEFTADTSGHMTLEAYGPTADRMPLDGNLILRAAELLRAERPELTLGAHIRVLKRLPAGAGLGGGSSDAATTLIALNRQWQLGLSEDRLCALGVALGADVPVFVRGRSAWAEGVGEVLTPTPLGSPLYLVVTPDCSVSTQRIFTQPDLTRNSLTIKMADFLAGRSRNDCEPITRSLYPPVAAAIDWLSGHADARMTGTGASIFAKFPERDSAQLALDDLPSGWSGFIANGVDHAPR